QKEKAGESRPFPTTRTLYPLTTTGALWWKCVQPPTASRPRHAIATTRTFIGMSPSCVERPYLDSTPSGDYEGAAPAPSAEKPQCSLIYYRNNACSGRHHD